MTAEHEAFEVLPDEGEEWATCGVPAKHHFYAMPEKISWLIASMALIDRERARQLPLLTPQHQSNTLWSRYVFPPWERTTEPSRINRSSVPYTASAPHFELRR
jgi:hypothetical protein